MKHIVQLDDKTKIGKNLVGIIHANSAQNKEVVFLDEEADTIPFDVFAIELKSAVNKRLPKKQ